MAVAPDAQQARPDLWVNHFTVGAPPNPTISHLRGLDYVRRTAEVARKSVGSAREKLVDVCRLRNWGPGGSA
jgi:hypothetical protein